MARSASKIGYQHVRITSHGQSFGRAWAELRVAPDARASTSYPAEGGN